MFHESVVEELGSFGGALSHRHHDGNGGLEGPVFILAALGAVHQFFNFVKYTKDIVILLELLKFREHFKLAAKRRVTLNEEQAQKFGFLVIVFLKIVDGMLEKNFVAFHFDSGGAAGRVGGFRVGGFLTFGEE